MIEAERDDRAAYESNLSKGQRVEGLVVCQTLGFKHTAPFYSSRHSPLFVFVSVSCVFWNALGLFNIRTCTFSLNLQWYCYFLYVIKDTSHALRIKLSIIINSHN